ncbi:MAG: hypothetical protein JNL83_17820 [Myxococcales bacterium]|nr:hypothetical protein [Myxococcales bacterium]
MKKLLMFAAAGLLAVPATHAQAEVGTAEVSTMVAAPVNDLAPVSGTPARLRRTDEEQPGNEMAKFAMFADNKKGLFVSMATELNGQPATHRMQLAVVPFSLVQTTTGKVTAQPDMTKARFATNNIGNEYRNANHPTAMPIMDGKLVAVHYNYQPNNTNNTETYLQIFNDQGQTVMPQKRIMAKNNDDCGMASDSNNTVVFQRSATTARYVLSMGCNGNGRDDGWLNAVDITCQADMSSCTAQKAFDLSVVPREERSHAAVIRGTDENTVFMAYTEGNTQPQRDGTWLAAINIGPGQNGEGAQSRLLWKKQIGGRSTIEGLTTYSMRATLMPLTKWDTATGKLVPTDQFMISVKDLRGNNNNNGKGGTYYRNNIGVIEATAAGMKYIQPLKDISPDFPGLEATHMVLQSAWFGTTNAMTPGFMMVTGSHTGGGNAGKARAVTYDATTGKLADAGMYAIAPYDRHLYPNYLGNNPGNQGRNYGTMEFIANPYVGMNGNTDSHLMLFSSTGKDPSLMMDPKRKLTAYLTVLPVVTTPKVTTPPTQNPDPTNPNPPPTQNPDPTTPDEGTDEAGTALGGCSATTGSGGALSLLLIGLAAFIRRRR